MGARNFASASSQHMICGSSGTILSAGQTIVALVTVASLPGAGVYSSVSGFTSGTAARRLILHLNGDTGPGTLSLLIGSTRVVPSTSIIPTADGRWLLIGATKPNGTAAVQFFMYDFRAATWTEFASSATFADQTKASAFGCIGSDNGASFFNGRIAMTMYLPFDLAQKDWRQLVKGPWYWRERYGLMRRPTSNTGVITAPFGLYMDLRDEADTTGAGSIAGNTNLSDMLRCTVGGLGAPSFDASTNPPGF